MGCVSNDCDFDVLVGKTIVRVDTNNGNNAEIVFKCSDGTVYTTYHSQDCCESVWFEDSDNAPDSLEGETIVTAFVNCEVNPNACESGTYTFYTLASRNVSVTFRFNGESNGYYSESVDFRQIL